MTCCIPAAGPLPYLKVEQEKLFLLYFSTLCLGTQHKEEALPDMYMRQRYQAP